MIFVTVGTHEPFERLLRAVDEWLATHEAPIPFFGQTSGKGYQPTRFEFVDRLSPTEYQAQFNSADLIISHAGMGTILTALNMGKPIIIMPRRGHLSETRNDHQYTTVKHLGDRPGVYVAKDETEFGAVLSRALANIEDTAGPAVPDVAPVAFTNALRTFITQT